MKKLSLVFFSLIFISGLAVSAQAITYGFDCITNNNPTNAAIGEAQLFVDVTDPGGGSVDFKFYNTGPSDSSITDIYFDITDPSNPSTLLITGISIFAQSAGVSYGLGATPPNLPGGGGITPAFDADYSADSAAPVQPNGVNPGEYVTLRAALAGGKTFNDLLTALATGISSPASSGALRLGIHVQGFEGGGSESFVHIPLPPGVLLLGSGLLGLGLVRRRRP